MQGKTLGAAKTDAFMLSTATVMLGKQSDLFNLSEDKHSIGLVKNFAVKSEPKYTDLTQGVKNTIVYSVMTGNPVTASMEVFEYTMQNIAYSLGLEGAKVDNSVPLTDTVKTPIIAPVSPSVVGLDLVELTTGATFVPDQWVKVIVGADTFIRRVLTYTSATKTLKLDAGLPTAVPAGAIVETMGVIGIGSKDEQPFLSAKIAGQLANGDQVIILIPKLRIVNGFNLAFGSENFGNLPFQFTVFDLVNTDPNYQAFLPFGNAMLLA